MERGNVFFTRLEILVLDEADRMVDMGFAPDLSRILRRLPAGRQTLMFSATIPPELNAIARKALIEPLRIDVASKVKTAVGIREAVYPVPRNLKTEILLKLLEDDQMDSVLVFARTKRGADRIARELDHMGHPVSALHSNRTQGQRERALAGFRSGRYQVLVATDIASRGLDVEGISHVINYDVPHQPEDYVHRAGRTARASSIGDAFTLMARDEEEFVAAIERYTGKAIPRVILPDFNYRQSGAPRDGRPGRGIGPGRGGVGPRSGGRRGRREARQPTRSPRASSGAGPGRSAGAVPNSGRPGSFGRGPRKSSPSRRRRGAR
jgi:ATP-dependent RNA helicase RhlE